MRVRLLVAALVVACVQQVQAAGLLIPEDAKLPPLAMVNHRVTVDIDDQVAITTVEQSFRNHTDRNLEATYLFPVPKGASVNKLTMWIDGKETAGELLDAKKAHAIYTEIVRRTQDPALLEYLGNDLMRLRVFPILPRKDQKIKITFTSVAQADQGVVEYIYPLKTDGKATRTLEEFSVKLNVKSQHPIQTIYSPTHAISTKRKNDREVAVEFEKNQSMLDKDFQLFYSLGNQEIGLTPLTYRPVSSQDGFFMLLISPEMEAIKTTRVPRDLVLVLDTSGSMSDIKMSQAKKALKQLMGQLTDKDRFNVLGFASTVRTYEEKLQYATKDHLERATKWVDDLRAGGGTAIQPALDAAIDQRTKDTGRSFTVIFLTDGLPTLDERNPEQIVKNVAKRNNENTRIFTFGVGDDVNAAMLDQLAETTRAVSTYVRPAEDIEVKASALNGKISHPVMTNVKLTATNVKLHEVYPPKLPDLFHGGQLMVIGRYSGSGQAAIKLTGMVGSEQKELIYELNFPARTEEGKEFVEQLWARRKVGYLLDQIRINGESKEVVEEVTALAKKYGIATPYTSWLVVPDGPMPVIRADRDMVPMGGAGGGFGPVPPGIASPPAGPGGAPAPSKTVDQFAKEQAGKSDPSKGEGVATTRGAVQDKTLDEALKNLPADQRNLAYAEALKKAKDDTKGLKDAEANYKSGRLKQNQEGKGAVDLAVASQNLQSQNRYSNSANQTAYGRSCTEVGGVWIDDQFVKDTKTVVVKAQSEAYFRILEKQPKMKDVFRMGNYLVWVAPSGTALVVDLNDGKDKLTDAEIDGLFTVAKK